MVWLVVKYIMAAAAKDRMLISFLAIIAVSVSLSIFFGSSAVIEKDQFSIVFTASALRLSCVFTLILFCVFYVRKSFDTRDVEYMLSRPLSRWQYLLAHIVAFSLLSAVFSLLCMITLYFMPNYNGTASVLLWSSGLLIELIIMVNVALFFSFVLNSAVTATLICLAFYVLARMMGGILGIIATGSGSNLMALMEKLMLAISMVIPRFDLLGQGGWLLYGQQGLLDWAFIAGQGIVFLGLIISATYIDFKRKQF